MNNSVFSFSQRTSLSELLSRHWRQMALTIVIALFGSNAWAQNSIVIYQKNGKVAIYHFDEHPAVTYADQQLVMTSGGSEVMYPLSALQKMTLDDADKVTDLKEIGGETEYRIVAEGIMISGQQAMTVEIFDLKGTMHGRYTCDGNGSVLIPRERLRGGIFVVRCSNGVTFKIRLS